MRTTGETKRAARTALGGNWGNAVVITLITILIALALGFFVEFISVTLGLSLGIGTQLRHSIYSAGGIIPSIIFGVGGIAVIIGIVSLVMSLGAQLVTSNLSAGNAIYYLNLTSGKLSDIPDLFAQFKRGFLKPFGIYWLIALWQLLWVMAGYLPGCILFGLAQYFLTFKYFALGALCIFFAILLIISGIVLGIVAMIRYSMSYFVLADNPGLGVTAAVRRSKELMRGHKVDYFMLSLSFIGWIILAMFTFGIGLLFLVPYINTSYAVFYRDLTGRPVVGDMTFYNMTSSKSESEAPCDNTPCESAGAAESSIAEQENATYTGIPDAPAFEEVDISKIGAKENIPEHAQNTENGDNPEQNN